MIDRIPDCQVPSQSLKFMVRNQTFSNQLCSDIISDHLKTPDHIVHSKPQNPVLAQHMNINMFMVGFITYLTILSFIEPNLNTL